MSPPRPKKEYEERPPDDDGTPFERFQRALKQVIAVPKDALHNREHGKDITGKA